MTLDEADQVVHKVESQWHYPILTRYGFNPTTPEAKGFVRSYSYVNAAGVVVVCKTGVSCDYWNSESPKGGGYWSDLEPWLKKL